MAKSLLSGFVSSTRALLVAQLIACVGAVALAGWTLGITNQVLRERNRLQERVIQLEEAMASSGVIPPAATAVVSSSNSGGDTVYPGSIAAARSARTTDDQQNIGSVITTLFGPAPPLSVVVLHVRAESDTLAAMSIAAALGLDDAHVNVMTASDQRPSGYIYFDGRQSRAAAEIVARFHDAAREQQVAQWSAQLRGTALPARDEYTADRLDIILPPLPPPPPLPQPAILPDAATTTAPPQP